MDVIPQDNDQRNSTYLVGIGVSHSIAPPMHNYVSNALGLHWTFTARECATIEDVVTLFRKPTFAGGVVTMPYKIAIMAHLEGLGDHAKLIGACNNVYRASDGTLRGTNTDWRGVKGCLESGTKSGTGLEGMHKPALIIGAGGAARAALYVLHHEFNCRPIYIANRDADEVDALIRDASVYNDKPELLHLSSLDAATQILPSRGYPHFIVGTVPDFEPTSPSELQVRDVIEHCLAHAPESGNERGVLLDMCFKPRRTRTIKLAQKHGWLDTQIVEGISVIGYQIEEQYRLWLDVRKNTPITSAIQQGAWTVLRKAADESTAINF